jgi:hypothetical protein
VRQSSYSLNQNYNSATQPFAPYDLLLCACAKTFSRKGAKAKQKAQRKSDSGFATRS